MTALLMEYPQYNNPQQGPHVQLHQEHHDLDDTVPGNRRGVASEADLMGSFSPANDMNIFGMLNDNSYAHYNSSSGSNNNLHNDNINNPSMTSLLFQNPAASASPKQACDDGAAFANISPATMWLGSGSSMSTRGAEYLRDGSVSTAPNATMLKPRFDDQPRMASPDQDMSMSQPSSNKKNLSRKRRDSQMDLGVNKKERKESTTSNDDGASPSGGGGSGHKRDKYREKNRVAAAKCRAKKKDHVDTLEDSHRTQSVLKQSNHCEMSCPTGGPKPFNTASAAVKPSKITT
ncbi:hypothetical protein MBLNU457_3873t1 [Dothideomycetes sp. NU457]